MFRNFILRACPKRNEKNFGARKGKYTDRTGKKSGARKGVFAEGKYTEYYAFIMIFTFALLNWEFNVYAAADMWTTANTIIVDLYNKIAGISTVLAGLMSAVAVIGAKLSNNQHKVDQSWDWLRRIWVAWAVINGIGAFIAYIRPLFSGLNTIS